MRLRILMVMAMALGLSANLCAQGVKNIGVLGDGRSFYSGISARINMNMDTLSNLLISGTMYVRFDIGVNGISNVKCSPSAPEILQKVISEALLKTDKNVLSKKAITGLYYVLPVEYDFENSGQPKKLSALIQRIPSIDEIPTHKDINSDFVSLFEITNDNSGNLYGIHCILLQTLKIRGKIQ